jgi:hypothetical protein
MKRRHKHLCAYCNKEKEKCRIVSVIGPIVNRKVDDRPKVEWCCLQCWDLELMDNYLYEHHQRVGDKPV